MLDKNKIVDGILYVDDDNPAVWVVFNFHTWVEIIKAIIVKYAHKSEDEAESLLMSSYLVNEDLDDYGGIEFRCHYLEYEWAIEELVYGEYHWAMLLVYGEPYWTKEISSKLPEDYIEWDTQYRKDHNLAEECFIWSNSKPLSRIRMCYVARRLWRVTLDYVARIWRALLVKS